MLSIWPLLAAAICAVSVSAVSRKRIIHGRQLTLDLPERTEILDFASSDESVQYTIWEHKIFAAWRSKAKKGEVTSANNGWTFRIKRVTFDDEGSYTLRNYFGSTISTYTVKVDTNNETIERIAGETLTIPLAGISLSNATLRFHNNDSTITLVENGVAVGKRHSEYYNRLELTSDVIKVQHVNISDLGRYELTDQKGRLVSNNTMILVDHHPFTSNMGLMAFLLLGVPGGICFCCRKRICKGCRTNKSYDQTAQYNSPNSVPVSMPCSNTVSDPGYNGGYPPQPDQGPIHHPPPEWSGQPAVPPNPGFHPGTVPQNPIYPPLPEPGVPPAQPSPWNNPAPQYNPPAPEGFNPGNVPQNPVYPPQSGPGYPPVQPPQWSGPPPQYNPSAPLSYTPIGPETTGLTVNDMPPTAPLLTPQPEPRPSALASVSMDILNSNDSNVQFDINKGKSSSNNFL